MALAEISAALAAIKSAMEIVTGLRDGTASLEKAELNMRLADLMGALAETKMQMAQLTVTLSEKDEEIRCLRDDLEAKDTEKIVWSEPYYFRITNGGQEGPFCQRCYDVEIKLVRLQALGAPGYWACANCQTHFTDHNYDPPAPVSVPAPSSNGPDWSQY